MNKPIYKLIDGKGRVLIPKSLRDAAGMGYGDIVRLGLSDGRVTIRKGDIVEGGGYGPGPAGLFQGREAISPRRRWKPMSVPRLSPCRTAPGWS